MRRSALSFATFVLMSAIPAPAAEYAPKVGERHADFILPHIATGKPTSLSDFRGKKVLLIHFSSW